MGNKLKRLFQHNSPNKIKRRKYHLDRLNEQIKSTEEYIEKNKLALNSTLLKSLNIYLSTLYKEANNIKSKLDATTF